MSVRKRLLLSVAVLALSCGFPALAVYAAPPSDAVVLAFQQAGLPLLRNSVAPADFTLPLLSGAQQKLSDLKGKVVILNFWATWCPPCRAEMPSMEALYSSGKVADLAILAVDLQEKAADVQSFLTKQGFTFPVAIDASGSVARRYGASSIPTTYLIDKSGQIVSRFVGGVEWNSDAVIAALNTLGREKE
jgi:peroxiredoxin